MTDKIELARKFIAKYGVARDGFLYILSYFQNNPEETNLKYNYKGVTMDFEQEPWMLEVKGKRKLYELAVGCGSVEVGYGDGVVLEGNENVSDRALLKQIYRLQERNRKLNKLVKGDLSEISEKEELLKEIKESLKKVNFNIPEVRQLRIDNTEKIAVICFADWHINSLINQFDNKFDVRIASKRIKYFIDKSIEYFLCNEIETVYVFGLGDFVKNLKRDSEKLNTSTSRVNAGLIAVKLIRNVIKDLTKYFNVKFASVIGNESRLLPELELSDIDASENMDYIIAKMLESIFESCNSVEFIKTDLVNGIVHIPEINKTVLITHGLSIPQNNTQKKIQELVGKYAGIGTTIDYVFYGHYHNSSLGDKSSRIGSLCGSDSFAGITLAYDSKASQSCFIMRINGSVDGIKIDLQDIDYIGYDLESEIEKFNVRLINNGK